MEAQLADGRDELAAECAKLDHMERRLVGSNAQRQRELDRLRADARKTESGAARLGEYHEQVRRAARHSGAILRNSARFRATV